MRWSTLATLVVVVLCGQNVSQAAENWPQWRGPSATGVAAAGEYPLKFSRQRGPVVENQTAREGDIDARCLGRSDLRYLRHRRAGRRSLLQHAGQGAVAEAARQAAAGQKPARERQQFIARDRWQASRRVFQERHAGLFRFGGERKVARPIFRRSSVKTRCGGT